ncbi:MAG: hypothetical protein AB1689_07400 [Thermodesulfobacteriota bacterium]
MSGRGGPCGRDVARGIGLGQGGFTVLELLLGALLATLVVAAGVELLRVQVAVARRLQASLAATGGAGWALAVAARDAQVAGSDPRRTGVVALSAAGGERAVLESDRDGDGAVDAASEERVILAWSPSASGRFVRWLGSQSMSIASLVRAGGLRLRYFDAAGTELVPGAGELPAADRDRVRRLALELDVTEQAGVVAAQARLRAAAALRLRLEER